MLQLLTVAFQSLGKSMKGAPDYGGSFERIWRVAIAVRWYGRGHRWWDVGAGAYGRTTRERR